MPRTRATTPRKRPSQARSRALVAAILEAAARVLEARGHEGATVARIAERAGVSIGSVYQYFRTKDAIFEALAADLLARILHAAGPALLDPTLPFGVRIERGMLAGLDVLRPHPTVLRQLAACIGSAFRGHLQAARAHAYAYAALALPSHPHADRLTDLGLAARVLVDAVEGVMLNLRPDDDTATIARETRRLVEGYGAHGR